MTSRRKSIGSSMRNTCRRRKRTKVAREVKGPGATREAKKTRRKTKES